MKQCANCINRQVCHYIGQMNSFAVFCLEHDMCSFEQDVSRPAYSMEVAKQLIFDCADELYHGNEGLTRFYIANKLIDILKEMDKM